jgi:ABC-2 type transport system permease protein
MLAAKYGSVDLGAALAGYIGVGLAVGAVLAIGMFISSLCANQITAGVLTLITALALILMPMIGGLLPPGAEGFTEILRQTFDHINLLGHMDLFTRGIVDVRAGVYFATVAYLFLFLTVRVVESRRWR